MLGRLGHRGPWSEHLLPGFVFLKLFQLDFFILFICRLSLSIPEPASTRPPPIACEIWTISCYHRRGTPRCCHETSLASVSQMCCSSLSPPLSAFSSGPVSFSTGQLLQIIAQATGLLISQLPLETSLPSSLLKYIIYRKMYLFVHNFIKFNTCIVV